MEILEPDDGFWARILRGMEWGVVWTGERLCGCEKSGDVKILGLRLPVAGHWQMPAVCVTSSIIVRCLSVVLWSNGLHHV